MNGSGFDNLVIRLDNHGAVFVCAERRCTLAGNEKGRTDAESDDARGMP